MIAVLVCKKHAIKLLRRHASMLQTQHQLSRAEPAVHQNLAVISRNECAVSRAPAAEHDQAEHGSQASRLGSACANGDNENNEARMTRLRQGFGVASE